MSIFDIIWVCLDWGYVGVWLQPLFCSGGTPQFFSFPSKSAFPGMLDMASFQRSKFLSKTKCLGIERFQGSLRFTTLVSWPAGLKSKTHMKSQNEINVKSQNLYPANLITKTMSQIPQAKTYRPSNPTYMKQQSQNI